MLNHAAGGAKASIGLDGQRGDTAPAVVGNQHTAAGFVQRDMAGAGAAGRLLVEQGQFAGGRIHLKGADRSGAFALEVADFPDGVQPPAIGMSGEEGRVPGLRRQFRGAQAAGIGIEAGQVDALTARARVGADIDAQVLAHGRGGQRQQTRRQPGGGMARAPLFESE